mmetsp:Transcript_32086/g.54065  ORF Transcript_32086/g.54065 Transcript_32086/m.54065 type:complete len:121 (+) Transcript_32086:24-386(+)
MVVCDCETEAEISIEEEADVNRNHDKSSQTFRHQEQMHKNVKDVITASSRKHVSTTRNSSRSERERLCQIVTIRMWAPNTIERNIVFFKVFYDDFGPFATRYRSLVIDTKRGDVHHTTNP